MYEECLECLKIGKACDGPNFFAMSTPELLAWCKARKAALHLSNARLAELSDMPKGTIDRLFAGEHVDFRYETIRPLLKALTGGEWKGLPCAEPPADNDLQKKVQELEAEIRWRDDKIQHYADQNKRLQDQAKDDQEKHDKEVEFLRGESKRKNTVITVLGIVAALAVLYIAVITIIDRLDPSRGYWWMESTLRLPQSLLEKFEQYM